MARRMARWLIRETGRFIPIRSMDDNWLGRRVRIATAVILEMAPGKPRNQKTRKFRIRPVFVTGNEFKLRSHVHGSLGWNGRERKREREGGGGEKEFQSILRLVTVLKSHDLRRLHPPGNGIAKDIATELTFSSRGHCSCHWTNQPPSQRERLSCLHGNSHQRRFASIAATGF